MGPIKPMWTKFFEDNATNFHRNSQSISNAYFYPKAMPNDIDKDRREALGQIWAFYIGEDGWPKYMLPELLATNYFSSFMCFF